jgi:Restriction endonuclease S subunits
MSEWKECSLGEVVTFQRGFDITQLEQSHGDYPVVSSSGIKSYHSECKVKGPGVVIGRKGTLGTVFYLKNDFWPHDTTLWVKDFHGNIPLFAFYFLKEFEFGQYDVGSSNPTLNRNHIHVLPCKIPPLPEQRAIASVLSSLDDKIDLLHRQNKTLEAMAETLFRQWFVEEAGEGWENGKLEEVMKISNGKSRPKTIGIIPVYGGNGILDYTDQFNFDGESIIIGRVGAYCGSIFFENRKIWVSDNALHVRSKDENENFYLYYLLKTLELNSLAEGSSHPLLTQTLLNSIDISIPPIKLRNGFNTFAKMLNTKITQNIKKLRTLGRLRDTLLPKLMSGEVRVTV